MLVFAVAFVATFLLFDTIHTVISGHHVSASWAAADVLASWLLTMDLFIQSTKDMYRDER
jgi:hypothetical protein